VGDNETDGGVRYPLSGASRAIVADLVIHGPRSRAELAERLRLSPGSLTRLTKPLVDVGLLLELAAVAAGQGRPSTPLDVVATAWRFVGVKLTGSEAFAVLADLRARVLSAGQARLTSQTPDDVSAVVAGLVDQLSGGSAGPVRVGITFGGHSPDRVTAFAPFLGWREGVPLAEMVTRATGRPCVLDNDVVAFAESQHWFGAVRGRDRFALVTIGAGIGYALVAHNRILRSQEADIGVFGHHIIDRNGPHCPEGHRGCVAAYLTSEALATAASAALRRLVSYEQALDLAAAGDPTARQVVDEAGVALGRLLSSVAALSMTTTIILSGEGARLAVVAADAVQAGIKETRPSWADPLDLDVQEIDFTEWARGAAVVAMQRFVLGVA
jgi:predicted NBD/HSP70 family sugar kinase